MEHKTPKELTLNELMAEQRAAFTSVAGESRAERKDRQERLRRTSERLLKFTALGVGALNTVASPTFDVNTPEQRLNLSLKKQKDLYSVAQNQYDYRLERTVDAAATQQRIAEANEELLAALHEYQAQEEPQNS